MELFFYLGSRNKLQKKKSYLNVYVNELYSFHFNQQNM